MRNSMLSVIMGIALLLAGNMDASGQVRHRTARDNGQIISYFENLGHYYRVPYRDVVRLHRRGIAMNEIPVILFLSARSGVKASTIVRMRLRGSGWMDISLRCGIGAEAFGTGVIRRSGVPRGNAYGHFKRHRASFRTRYLLSDEEITSAVNIRFLTAYYGYDERDILRLRTGGRDFVSMGSEFCDEGRTSTDDPADVERRDRAYERESVDGERR